MRILNIEFVFILPSLFPTSFDNFLRSVSLSLALSASSSVFFFVPPVLSLSASSLSSLSDFAFVLASVSLSSSSLSSAFCLSFSVALLPFSFLGPPTVSTLLLPVSAASSSLSFPSEIVLSTFSFVSSVVLSAFGLTTWPASLLTSSAPSVSVFFRAFAVSLIFVLAVSTVWSASSLASLMVFFVLFLTVAAASTTASFASVSVCLLGLDFVPSEITKQMYFIF